MPQPNPNLKDFWLTHKVNGNRVRFRVLYGGRDSSKSWDAAARAMWLAHRGKLRIMCTRMYQNRIEESVYTTIKRQIHRFGMQNHFDIQRSKIYSKTGSEFLFYGLARNIEEVKSTEGIDILWVEEGHSMTDEMWKILEPTIRKEGSEIWIVFNPDLRTDFIWQRFVEDPPANALVRKINYDENPFLSDTSQSTIDRIQSESYEDYEHIYLGVPKEDDEAVIIKRAWVEAAIDAHKKLGIEPQGVKQVGYDVADSGDDANAVAVRYGVLIKDTEQWNAGEDQLMNSTKKAYNWAAKEDAKIVYDSIGVGAGVGSKADEINDNRSKTVEHEPFNAGGKVLNPEREYMPGVIHKDHFKNLKAQSWWLLADRFRETYNAVTKGEEFDESEIISIAGDCNNLQQLITELSTPKREYDGSGRLKVEKKKDMLKRGVKSPNLADAVVMAFAPTKQTKEYMSFLA